MLAGIVDGDLGQFVLDLVDDAAGAEDADASGFGVDLDVDVLVAGDAAIGRLDAVLDGPDQLLTGDLLLGVELEEGAHEVSTHDRLLFCARCQITAGPKKRRGGHPRHGAAVQLREVYTRMRGRLKRRWRTGNARGGDHFIGDSNSSASRTAKNW